MKRAMPLLLGWIVLWVGVGCRSPELTASAHVTHRVVGIDVEQSEATLGFVTIAALTRGTSEASLPDEPLSLSVTVSRVSVAGTTIELTAGRAASFSFSDGFRELSSSAVIPRAVAQALPCDSHVPIEITVRWQGSLRQGSRWKLSKPLEGEVTNTVDAWVACPGREKASG